MSLLTFASKRMIILDKPGEIFKKIYALVSLVPSGKVTTYGHIAKRLGINNPKVVGYALHSDTMQDSVPWHRIINSKGTVSKRATGSEELQKQLLVCEGVKFDVNQRVIMEEYFIEI